MSEWLRKIYVKRPGGFFYTAPSLLIYDSMRAHFTDVVKKQVMQTNSVLAVIPGGLTKELQPLDIGVNRAFKAFRKAGIITELPNNSSDTDSDNDEMEPGMLDAVLAQLFNSDTEEGEFEGYVDGE